MIENDANRTLILDKNYNVILVTLRYIIWMYLGFFFSLLMADHTKIALTLMSFLSLSMDLSMIWMQVRAHASYLSLDWGGTRRTRSTLNSAVLSVFTAYVLQHKNVKTNSSSCGALHLHRQQ